MRVGQDVVRSSALEVGASLDIMVLVSVGFLMARPLRLEFPGAIYHVTARGNARQAIVLDDRDHAGFLACLGETIARFG